MKKKCIGVCSLQNRLYICSVEQLNIKAMKNFDELTAEQQQAVSNEQDQFEHEMWQTLSKNANGREYLSGINDFHFPFATYKDGYNLFITPTIRSNYEFDLRDFYQIIEVAEEYDTYEIKLKPYKGNIAICIGFKYVDGMELI